MPHLIDHPLIAQALADVRPHLSANVEKIAESVRRTGDPPAPVPESDEEGYEAGVARRVIALLSRFERLREAQRYVERTPAPAVLKKLDATQDGWIEYHYSQYLGALFSIGDICLLLCNAVFHLGISARLCTKDAVRSNKWVKRTEVPKAIDRVEAVIREHRQRRNLDVHRGTTPDLGGIIGDRTFDMLRMVGIVARSTGDGEALRVVSRGFRAMSADLAHAMSREIDELEEAVRALLEQLSPVYKDKSPMSMQRMLDEVFDPTNRGGAA